MGTAVRLSRHGFLLADFWGRCGHLTPQVGTTFFSSERQVRTKYIPELTWLMRLMSQNLANGEKHHLPKASSFFFFFPSFPSTFHLLPPDGPQPRAYHSAVHWREGVLVIFGGVTRLGMASGMHWR